MRIWKGALAICGASVWLSAVHAQGRAGGEWTTTGGDAQRSSWIRTDPKIGPTKMAGFALDWKIKLGAEPTMAATLDRYIGYRGFRSLALMGSASGELTAIDTDLGRIEWTKKLPGSSMRATAGCSGGMTANVARNSPVAFVTMAPTPGRGGGGGGRGGAKSDVGQPGEGAVTIAAAAAAEAARAARGPVTPPPGAAAAPGRGATPGRGPRRNVEMIHAITSDGMYHAMYTSNGEEPVAASAFLPANANARDLIVVDGVAYAATTGGCGGAPNGVWAMDAESHEVVHWSPASGDVAGGGFAFGTDNKLYAATTTGDLVALDSKKLEVQNVYRGGQAFSGGPVVFEYKTKVMVAAPTTDGQVHLVDAASMTGAAFPAAAVGPLASWQDGSGRWIMAATKSGITAWKVVDQGDSVALQAGWTAPMASPMAPMVINGVVFTLTNSPSAVLHALDGWSGKELWTSGKTMTAAAKIGSISGSSTRVYIGTSDGMIYAFGYPIEH